MNLDAFGLTVPGEKVSPHWRCLKPGCGGGLRERFPMHYQCTVCDTWRRVAASEYAELGLTPPDPKAVAEPTDRPNDPTGDHDATAAAHELVLPPQLEYGQQGPPPLSGTPAPKLEIVQIINDLHPWTHPRSDGEEWFNFHAIVVKKVRNGWTILNDIVTARDPVFHRDDWPGQWRAQNGWAGTNTFWHVVTELDVGGSK